MNKKLLDEPVQQFLREHFRDDIAKVLFRGSPFTEIPVRELAEQLVGMEKARKKLPTWFKTEGILYPPSINLEQTSSETTAAYKSSLIKGNTLADLTGGFGVDSYFFSKQFKSVLHCEIDKDLSELVAHNIKKLGVGNITSLASDGIIFAESVSEKLDWIYLDPSRRNGSGGKVFKLADCLPNVPDHLDLLLSKSSGIMIKTSPMVDLQAGMSELKFVQEVHIIAVDNEVKELLFILKEQTSGNPKIRTVNFRGTLEEIYEGYFAKPSTGNFGGPCKYLFEPNAAIMKSGLFSSVGEDFVLQKLHPNSHLFTSDELKTFPGRRFEISGILPYNKRIKKSLNLKKANITTRNFPESVAGLRKQLKLKEGGDNYLFFTTSLKGDKVCLICRRI